MSELLTLSSAGLVGADNSAIATWTDDSGNGDATQATAGLRPTLKTNILNGKPVARYAAADKRLAVSSFALGTTFTLIAVVTQGSTAGTRTILHASNRLFWGHIAHRFETLFGNGSAFSATPSPSWILNPSTTHVLVSVVDGTTQRDYADGYLVGVSNLANPASFSGQTLEVGGTSSVGGWDGDIAYIQVLDTAMPTNAVVELMSGLMARYGVSAGAKPANRIPGQLVSPASGTFKSSDCANPNVFRDDNRWVMNFSGFNGTIWREGLAYSDDLLTWTEEPSNPIFALEPDETYIAANGSIVKLGPTYCIYYQATIGNVNSIRCRSASALTGPWTLANDGYPVIPTGVDAFDFYSAGDPYARVMADGTIELIYVGFSTSNGSVRHICRATSTDGVTFTKHGEFFAAPAHVTQQVGYGEPALVRDSVDELKCVLTYDWAPDARLRRTAMVQSTDGGATWSEPRTALGQGTESWESSEVFDSSPVVDRETMYLFYAGSASTSGANDTLDARIGVATLTWPFASVTTLPSGMGSRGGQRSRPYRRVW